MSKKYTGTWNSVNEHEVPKWYDGCKFGIFIHWGIYSVPAFAPRTWELGAVETNEEWFCNNPYAEWYYNSINVGQGPTARIFLMKISCQCGRLRTGSHRSGQNFSANQGQNMLC